MVHCNPAPPNPPSGEISNVICIGKPYINGHPVGLYVLATVAVILCITMLWMYRTQSRQSNKEGEA